MLSQFNLLLYVINVSANDTIMSTPTSLEVLLLGSSPLESTEEFLTTTSSALAHRLHQIPDGETGVRSNFIAWQLPTLPIEIAQPRWGGQPSAESRAKIYNLEDIKHTGYDGQAIASYAIFRKLKAEGKIPPSVRFQVCLPTPLAVVRGFVEDDGVCAQVDPLYEQRLLQAVRNIQDRIPPSELSIQWDLPTEIAILEHERGNTDDPYWKPYFSPVKDGILQRLVRLAADVSPDAQMGYHLCYGDFGHEHFVQPSDMSLLVDLANAIVEKVSPLHRIAYFHMPVPKDRKDERYFSPLKKLELDGAKFFLGVVHAHDEHGTRERLDVARSFYPAIAGVGTECGMGRTPRNDVGSILEICASV